MVKGLIKKFFNGTEGFVEFHSAVDESLVAQERVGFWEVVDGDSEVWTEPDWFKLGFAVFNDTGEENGGGLAFNVIGVTFGVASLLGGWVIALRWTKEKQL